MPAPSSCSFTVRKVSPFVEILAEHVDLSTALDTHEAVYGHAVIIDERDGLMACMVGIDLACECPRCAPELVS